MNVNGKIIDLYTQLDNQEARLKMIVGEIKLIKDKDESKKSIELFTSVVKGKMKSNLELVESILGTLNERL